MYLRIGFKGRPTTVKMDIEGYEFGAVTNILTAPAEKQPLQILMEIHAETWSIHAIAKAAESVFFGRLDYSIEYFMMFDEMFELNSAKYVGF